MQKSFKEKGKFRNQTPTAMDTSLRGSLSILRDFMKSSPNRKPARPIAMDALNFRLGGEPGQAAVTWFGHSAFLLRMSGFTLLIDPMLGRSPSPVPLFGSRRYSGRPPVEIEDLPPVDAVIFSHDHYDHLDRGSVKKLKGKVRRFFVPLGVKRRLVKWGVEESRISELDWWDETEFEGLSLACTPARHFSGRGLTDRDSTLWCSWVISDGHTKLFYSGDSGYAPHFAEIGEKYGPFDLTLMECGQYDKRWAAIHMMPEETVQAHLDVKGKVMIPIHWGAFTLALHDWTEPVERAVKAAKERGVTAATPRIGQTLAVGQDMPPTAAWWRLGG